jgi:DNA-binding NarL/FixJ family response regulator
MIKVLVCEDQPLVRRCLVEILDMEAGISVVGEAADGSTAVARADELEPDVVLMDIEMPVMDGIEATRIISTEHPETRVLVLTSHYSREEAMKCLGSGAAGFLTKDRDIPDLATIIEHVYNGEPYIEPPLARDDLVKLARGPQAEPR